MAARRSTVSTYSMVCYDCRRHVSLMYDHVVGTHKIRLCHNCRDRRDAMERRRIPLPEMELV